MLQDLRLMFNMPHRLLTSAYRPDRQVRKEMARYTMPTEEIRQSGLQQAHAIIRSIQITVVPKHTAFPENIHMTYLARTPLSVSTTELITGYLRRTLTSVTRLALQLVKLLHKTMLRFKSARTEAACPVTERHQIHHGPSPWRQ